MDQYLLALSLLIKPAKIVSQPPIQLVNFVEPVMLPIKPKPIEPELREAATVPKDYDLYCYGGTTIIFKGDKADDMYPYKGEVDEIGAPSDNDWCKENSTNPL